MIFFRFLLKDLLRVNFLPRARCAARSPRWRIGCMPGNAMNTCPKCGLRHYSEDCPSNGGAIMQTELCPYCGGKGCVHSPLPYEDDPVPCQACGGTGKNSLS